MLSSQVLAATWRLRSTWNFGNRHATLDSLRDHSSDRHVELPPNGDRDSDRLVLDDLSWNLPILRHLLGTDLLTWDLNLDGNMDRLLDLLILQNATRLLLSLVLSHRNLIGELLGAGLLLILNLLDEMSDRLRVHCLGGHPWNSGDTLALLRHRDLDTNRDGPQDLPGSHSIFNTLNRDPDRLDNVAVDGLVDRLGLCLQSRFRRHDGFGPADVDDVWHGFVDGDRLRSTLILNLLFKHRSLFGGRLRHHDLLANDLGLSCGLRDEYSRRTSCHNVRTGRVVGGFAWSGCFRHT